MYKIFNTESEYNTLILGHTYQGGQPKIGNDREHWGVINENKK